MFYCVCIHIRKIHIAKLGLRNSSVESLYYWVCMPSREVHLAKLGSSHSTLGPRHLQGIYRALAGHVQGIFGNFFVFFW